MGMVRFFWRALSMLAFFLAILGAALPLLPTVPFLLVSAWAASKGSPAFEQWLLYHPRFGAPVRAWRERGAISRRGKWLATVLIIGSLTLLSFTVSHPWLVIIAAAILLGVLIWLWLREEY